MIATLTRSNRVQWVLETLRQLPVATKMAVIAITDFLICVFIVLLAHSLRISALVLPQPDVLNLYLVAPVFSVAFNAIFKIYWSASRSHSGNTELRIVWAQLCAALLWIGVLLAFGTGGFARSVVVIYSVFAVLGMIVVRRFMSEVFTTESRAHLGGQDPIIIFGAAPEGLAVLNAIRRHRRYRPVAFVDTDYTLVGRTVAGLRVHAVEEIDAVLARHKPKELILAKSGLSRSGRRILLDMVAGRGVTVKTIPDQNEVLDKDLQFSELKPIKIEDLLGRDPVPPDRALMESAVKDQIVMVTGAGGSIGSEIVRQAIAFLPRKIVLVDNSEFALFEIHREMEAALVATKHDCVLVPLLADVRHKTRMADIIAAHGVDIVFHAAAYKHVRMVQENVAAGIDNNIMGTLAVAEAALAQGVKRFILISTDKAVRPTSVMGATKRVAEMIVQSFAAEKKHETIFAMVRFGNVLGSTGSVVPLFREQIARGGPITVTHPDVTRYFMLVPEAAQLVIQASAMARGGEVFVLDMGEPVKIVDLAESMIELAGLQPRSEKTPDGDIEVKFTGLHRGEKMYEELQIGDDVVPTMHARIMQCNEVFLPRNQLARKLGVFSNLKKPEDQLSEHVLQLAGNSGPTRSKKDTLPSARARRKQDRVMI